jgi:hypothetical protein
VRIHHRTDLPANGRSAAVPELVAIAQRPLRRSVATSLAFVAAAICHTLARVSYRRDPRVDAYIDGLPQWQQAICQHVRDLIHGVDPQVQETIKRRVQPYFVLEGNICALLATKDHINVFLYDGAIVPDPARIITGGHDNRTARTVAIHQNEAINEPALTAVFGQIIANNRAGGWRKPKTRGDEH